MIYRLWLAWSKREMDYLIYFSKKCVCISSWIGWKILIILILDDDLVKCTYVWRTKYLHKRINGGQNMTQNTAEPHSDPHRKGLRIWSHNRQNTHTTHMHLSSRHPPTPFQLLRSLFFATHLWFWLISILDHAFSWPGAELFLVLSFVLFCYLSLACSLDLLCWNQCLLYCLYWFCAGHHMCR